MEGEYLLVSMKYFGSVNESRGTISMVINNILTSRSHIIGLDNLQQGKVEIDSSEKINVKTINLKEFRMSIRK